MFDGSYTNTQPTMVNSPILQLKEEENSVDSDIQYIGKAPYGKGIDENCWLIKRVTSTATGTTVEWASTDFDAIWEDRESISYA